MPKSQWIKAYLKLLQDTTIPWPSKWTMTTKGPRSRISGYPLGYKRRTKRKSKPPPIIEAFPTTYKENQNNAIYWDSDGQQLMVDNGASASITPYLTDFITPPQPINSKVKGIGGHAQATYKGTVTSFSTPKLLFHCHGSLQDLMSSTLGTNHQGQLSHTFGYQRGNWRRVYPTLLEPTQVCKNNQAGPQEKHWDDTHRSRYP